MIKHKMGKEGQKLLGIEVEKRKKEAKEGRKYLLFYFVINTVITYQFFHLYLSLVFFFLPTVFVSKKKKMYPKKEKKKNNSARAYQLFCTHICHGWFVYFFHFFFKIPYNSI